MARLVEYRLHCGDGVGWRVVGQKRLELGDGPGGITTVAVDDHTPEEVGVGVRRIDGDGLIERGDGEVAETGSGEQPALVGERFDVLGVVLQDRVVRPEMDGELCVASGASKSSFITTPGLKQRRLQIQSFPVSNRSSATS